MDLTGRLTIELPLWGSRVVTGRPVVSEMAVPQGRDQSGTANAPRRIPQARLLSSLVQSADDAIFATAIDGTIMSWNAGAERMYGYSAAEIIGSSVARLVPPDRADEITQLLSRTAAGQHVAQFETVHVAKDGRRLDVSLTISPIRDGRGRLIGASTVAREIISAQRAEVRAAGQRDFLELVPAAIVGVDRAGHVRLWNRGAAELFGWTAEDVLGRPVFDDVRPLFGEEPVRAEIAVQRRDGTSTAVLAAAFPVRDAAGMILEHVAIAIDISQRRRTEEELRQTMQLLNATQSVAHVGGWQLDVVHDVLFWTDETYRIHDTSPAEYTPTLATAIQFYAPESIPIITAAVQAAIEYGTPFDLELKLSTAKGRPISVRATCAVTMEQGRTEKITGAFQDITDRAEAQAALRRANAELQRNMSLLAGIVDGTNDHVHIKDLEGRYVLVNRADAGWFGLPVEDIIGRTDADLTDPQEAAVVTERDRSVIEAGGPVTYEQEATRGGVTRTWLTTKDAVRDETGHVTGVFAISREITEQKRHEAQLSQVAKMESLGQLAGGVAHDFNNLLTAMRGYSELVRQRLPAADTDSRADIDEVISNADRAAELIRQLLAFSRRQVNEPRAVDPAAVVDGIVPLLRRLLGASIEVATAAGPNVGLIRADPSQLEQVLINLGVNARDAMPDGGNLTIETTSVVLDTEYARLHPGATTGPHVLLAVSDTGTGMDAETQAHIFEPFFTTKGIGKGTGLGLASVFGIIKQSGGSVYVYSEPGEGTAFKIYLPRLPDEATMTPTDRPTATTPDSGSETILLVEDEAPVRAFARRTLEARGYTVLEAAKGADAIALAGAHPERIDLLVTDMVMPGMHGTELAEQLFAARPGLRALYISGFTENSTIQAGVAQPRFAYLPKPFSGEALGQAVRTALDLPPGASASRRVRARPRPIPD